MRRVDDDLRAAYRSLSEAESDQPGHDYDRGYLTGWYDERRHIRRRHPNGGFREPSRVAEFQLGYRHGRVDGVDRPCDWWPDFALGGYQGLARVIESARSRAAYTAEIAAAGGNTRA